MPTNGKFAKLQYHDSTWKDLGTYCMLNTGSDVSAVETYDILSSLHKQTLSMSITHGPVSGELRYESGEYQDAYDLLGVNGISWRLIEPDGSSSAAVRTFTGSLSKLGDVQFTGTALVKLPFEVSVSGGYGFTTVGGAGSMAFHESAPYWSALNEIKETL